MGDSYNCCWCWKRKPPETTPSDPSVDLSVNPVETDPSVNPIETDPCKSSSQGVVTTSINPSVNTTAQTISINPSTIYSPNQSQTVISPPSSTSKNPPPTLQEVISSFENIDIKSQTDDFIKAIEEILKKAQKHTQDAPSTSSSHTDKLSNWASFIQSGGKFLKFVNEHTKDVKINTKDAVFQSGEAAVIIGDILQQIGHLHWAVAVFSTVGYVVSKCAIVSQNKAECLELFRELIKLLSHIKNLRTDMPEEKEKLEEAFRYIVEASMSCASQFQSGKFFRFLKSKVNSETLTEIRSKIRDFYPDLILTVAGKLLRQDTVARPLLPEVYPTHAVGIEDQLKAVNEVLNMDDCSSFAVVIWGFGGIGKTTLAKAVVSKVDRDRYNYARIALDLVSEKNNYEKMQQQILKDAFPSYGPKQNLRDDADGRDNLTQAFKSKANKPVFLFIDNALHQEDLMKILPEDLRGLPEYSRILITTRKLDETDVFEDRGLQRKHYPVKTLSDDHAFTILCSDPATRDRIKKDLEKIVKLCKGIPLVLKIVAAHLPKQEYKVDRCTQILGALRKGGEIKQEDLSNRLFGFVFYKLEESTQEAFLDICYLFYYWSRRQVEYIVGAEEVASLIEAALITTVRREGSEEMLSVHDIILSMGLNMSKSSRITDEESWFEAEKNQAKLKLIKGVFIDENEDCVLEERHLDSMEDKLRILLWNGRIYIQAIAVTLPEIRCISTTWDTNCLNVEAFHKLSFLRCHKLPTKERGQLKLPESLRYIELYSQQPDEMKDFSETVPNSSLNEIRIQFSDKLVAFSDDEFDSNEKAFNKFIEGLNNLEHLQVAHCLSLCRFPEQVCMLQRLTTLNVVEWYALECLPECFGSLTSLKRLNLENCATLKELPPTFGQLTALTELKLYGCTSLKELPSNFGQLTALEHLDLTDCVNLKKLPSTFGQLTALKEVILEEGSSIIPHLKAIIHDLDYKFDIVTESGGNYSIL